jgi:hypothetical protein
VASAVTAPLRRPARSMREANSDMCFRMPAVLRSTIPT